MRSRWAVVALALAVTLVGAQTVPAQAGDPAPAGGLVDCPRCEASGKVACAECASRGEIYRLCEICGGSGEKPCPVCCKVSASGEQAQPGRLVCGYCGGKGTLGTSGKVCSRCEGLGTSRCDTCFGTGTVSCRKETFVRVCPRCRFAGKTTCPTCGGDGGVAPAVAEAARASPSSRQNGRRPGPGESPASQASSADRKEAPGGTEAPGIAPPSGRTGEAAADPPPGIAELRERFEKLVPVCEAHYDVFVEDLTPKAERVRAEARELLRRLRFLEGAAGSEAKRRLEDLIERTESFRRRWLALRGLLDEERKAFANAQRNWELREEALDGARGSLRAQLERQWAERLDIVVRILEKNAAPLIDDDPGWLAAEVASIETTWETLQKDTEEELTAMALALAAEAEAKADATAAAGDASPAIDPASGRPRKNDERTEKTSAGAAVAADSVAGPDRPRKDGGSPAGAASGTPSISAAPSAAGSPDPVAPGEGDPRRGAADSSSGSSGGGAWALLWGFAGFLSACAVFVAVSQFRKHRLEKYRRPLRERREEAWRL